MSKLASIEKDRVSPEGFLCRISKFVILFCFRNFVLEFRNKSIKGHFPRITKLHNYPLLDVMHNRTSSILLYTVFTHLSKFLQIFACVAFRKILHIFAFVAFLNAGGEKFGLSSNNNSNKNY